MRTVIAALSGAAVASILILACSDDSPPVADAAGQCDCPAAEAPLSGRLKLVKADPNDILAQQSGGTGAECPTGGVLVSGGCYVDSAPGGGNNQIFLRQAGPVRPPSMPEFWKCEFLNTGGGTETVHAEALCLMPAQ